MVPLTKGTAGPRAQYGKCPCFLHLAQKKPKQAFLMWKGKLVLFFFFFITHFFGVHVVCRSTFWLHRMYGALLFLSFL